MPPAAILHNELDCNTSKVSCAFPPCLLLLLKVIDDGCFKFGLHKVRTRCKAEELGYNRVLDKFQLVRFLKRFGNLKHLLFDQILML